LVVFVFLSVMEQELARRRQDGIEVRLLWRREDGALLVTVHDERSGETFRLEAATADVLDAYRHPFAHAHALRLAVA
jgi:hypothetical protein